MNSKIKHRLKSLADHLIDQDYDGTEFFLASWLRPSGGSMLANVANQQSSATRVMFSDENLGDADTFELDESPVSAEELREDGVELPAGISSANYRGWFCISVQSDQGEWSLYDFWCAIVEEDGHLVVGYYEITPPD